MEVWMEVAARGLGEEIGVVLLHQIVDSYAALPHGKNIPKHCCAHNALATALQVVESHLGQLKLTRSE